MPKKNWKIYGGRKEGGGFEAGISVTTDELETSQIRAVPAEVSLRLDSIPQELIPLLKGSKLPEYLYIPALNVLGTAVGRLCSILGSDKISDSPLFEFELRRQEDIAESVRKLNKGTIVKGRKKCYGSDDIVKAMAPLFGSGETTPQFLEMLKVQLNLVYKEAEEGIKVDKMTQAGTFEMKKQPLEDVKF